MSIFSRLNILAQVGTYMRSPMGGLVHIRTATKKVSGSKTNKNDSAGRRLGPKAYENHFVKTGQIIMRQRGTKIHPGENVGLGRDHTIFALEPGYVRFYLDPFHPLRKYVGVALKQDGQLPKPHFDPRVRRFGYKPLKGQRAREEEERMSRKEELAQPELTKKAEQWAQETEHKLALYSEKISEIAPELAQNDAAAPRLVFISRKLAMGETHAYAQEQATYDAVYEFQLAQRRKEISQEEADAKTAECVKFAADFDAKVTVDFAGQVHPYYTQEARDKRAAEIEALLSEYTTKIIRTTEKAEIEALIAEAGIFSAAERLTLSQRYLPAVLPETVPGTVIENASGKKVPKDAVAVRTFDPASRKVDTVYRTKDAFLQ